MTYQEVCENARKRILTCKVCPVCNGLGCGNTMPGPGSKAPGNGANVNWKAWQDIRLNMDVFAPDGEVDTGCELFGRKLSLPLLTGPIGALTQYSKEDVTVAFNDGIIQACAKTGVVDCFGDGVVPETLTGGLESLHRHGAAVIPVINPLAEDEIRREMKLASDSDALAVCLVVDSAGLTFWQSKGSGFSSRTEDQVRALRDLTDKPFLLKGIMTAKNARQAVSAGADAIIVSNHGGRVLPYTPATAEVLPEIVDAVGGRAKIIVDGGIRSGADIVKALALGADAVMICRPFAVAWFGGGAEGAELYVEKIRQELREAMYMCGARKLADIGPEMIRM